LKEKTCGSTKGSGRCWKASGRKVLARNQKAYIVGIKKIVETFCQSTYMLGKKKDGLPARLQEILA
jgi:hypothetical protein